MASADNPLRAIGTAESRARASRISLVRDMPVADVTGCRPDAPPMRVAYLLDQDENAGEDVIRREIQAVERRGVAVERVTSGARARPALAALLRAAVLRPHALILAFREALHQSRGSAQPVRRHLMYVAEACRLTETFSARGVSHVHAQSGGAHAEVAMLVRILGGQPYSFTVHSPDDFDAGARLHLERLIGSAKFVAAGSSYCRGQLFRRSRSEDWSKIRIIHRGLEGNGHRGDDTVRPAERRLVCVGRLCERNGQPILLEAMSRLVPRVGAFHLVLAGDGELRAEIEQQIRALGLERHVTITGPAGGDDVRREILAAQAVVAPGFEQGVPVAMMDAMALGRPVITTYLAGLPELVVSGETGWLVPAGSVEQLAEAIEACLTSSQDALAAIGEAARTRVLERHDSDREAERLVRLFRSEALSGEIEGWRS